MVAPILIGVTGTHSTGKSSFCSALAVELTARGLRVGRVPSFGSAAVANNIPLLSKHGYESTLWFVNRTLAAQQAVGVSADVVIVDRPLPDALAYWRAALEFRDEQPVAEEMLHLTRLIRLHLSSYQILLVTVLDSSLPLGHGRDTDKLFRELVAVHVNDLLKEIDAQPIELTSANAAAVMTETVTCICSKMRYMGAFAPISE